MPRLVSIITPTHDATYLLPCYRSLQRQTLQDFQWVLVPNNGVRLQPEIVSDDRVIVHPHRSTSVGELKRFACARAAGDVYVELDHDDILAAGALQTIAEAAEQHGFIYSDCAEFRADGVWRRPYSARCGWTYYDVPAADFPEGIFSRSVQAMRSFPATPRSLCDVLFAPNHVRAWCRDAYWAAGGHNPKLPVGDDHDLVCRTYLTGAGFAHVPQPLYFYRVHPANTVWSRNRDIHLRSAANCSRYLLPLVREWCRRHQLLEYELIVLTRELVCADDSVGYLRVDDMLHRIGSVAEMVALWNEIYRVLAPGGYLFVRVPRNSGTSRWFERSFGYFTARRYADCLPGHDCRFQLVSLSLEQGHIVAALSALKGQTQPGVCLI